MRRLPLSFTLAILLPGLVLGGLALRSASWQTTVLESQAVDLHESTTDRLALDVRRALEDRERDFGKLVDRWVAERGAADLAARFDSELTGSWPDARVGFAVNMAGSVLSPRADEPRVEQFLTDNSGFLTNSVPVEFVEMVQNRLTPAGSRRDFQRGQQQIDTRTVRPKQTKKSPVVPAGEEIASPPLPFQAIAAGGTSGSLSRFVGGELELLLWRRSEADIVFGAVLRPKDLAETWAALVGETAGPQASFCLALLDERGDPVALSREELDRDWATPFVASRIGGALPLWEATLYLADPEALGRQAARVRLGLIALIVIAVGSLAVGGVVLARDTRRQLEWARLKSEFVSNVSHELKTPLTSIRMFAELLAGTKQNDPEKAREFARIIRLESERLSRLVENVLDFDKLQRGEQAVTIESFDARPVLGRAWESIEPSLAARGIRTEWQAQSGPYPVRGAPDALTQVVVNLLSNAEKFSADGGEITLRTEREGDSLRLDVLDRGPGIEPGRAREIFEPFVRDGQAAGSGLGLYIAHELAQAQGGSLRVAPRSGGGSVFTLRVPWNGGETG